MISHPLPLPGCTPEPLLSYLKALGLLRIVSEQKDPDVRGGWKDEEFVLLTRLSREELIAFFLNEYRPSPILAPWGARSGFYPGSSEKSARAALARITAATDSRFTPFQEAIAVIRDLLEELGLAEKAEEEAKLSLLGICRSRLPEEMLSWLDTCYVLTATERKFPPLLGTGGNEGSGSYVSGFAQQVVACLVERGHDTALVTALFGDTQAGVVGGQVPGHFSPAAAGGANQGQGLSGPSLTNRWDYILGLEGSYLWASSVTRRFGESGKVMAAFPFTVNVSGAGASSMAGGDAKRPKQAKRDVAEMWLPLWERLLTLKELSSFLGEGRAAVGRRMATNGLDFARAVSGLGVDRGISAFQRIAFLMRNGQSFMGISLGRFEVRAQRQVDLLREIDPWLDRFRRACGDNSPARFTSALRSIESAIFDYCRYGSGQHGDPFFQAILLALGGAEREVANGESFRKNRQTGATNVAPLVIRSADWLIASADPTPEFHLALSLASIYDANERIGPVRVNLEPVVPGKGRAGNFDWTDHGRAAVWHGTDLAADLLAVLIRRQMDAARVEGKHSPLAFRYAAPLDAIARFLAKKTDDRRLDALLAGLLLLDPGHPPADLPPLANADDDPPLPRAYAMIKLLFLPFKLELADGSRLRIPTEATVPSLLRAGRVSEACRLAMRRLRSSGLRPFPHRIGRGPNRDDAWEDPATAALDGPRLAAALLFPISEREAFHLARLVLRPADRSDASFINPDQP